MHAGRFTARKEFRTKQAAQLSATSVLTDLLDAWCAATSQEMGLYQPEQFRKLQAAEAHVAEQEQQGRRSALVAEQEQQGPRSAPVAEQEQQGLGHPRLLCR